MTSTASNTFEWHGMKTLGLQFYLTWSEESSKEPHNGTETLQNVIETFPTGVFNGKKRADLMLESL